MVSSKPKFIFTSKKIMVYYRPISYRCSQFETLFSFFGYSYAYPRPTIQQHIPPRGMPTWYRSHSSIIRSHPTMSIPCPTIPPDRQVALFFALGPVLRHVLPSRNARSLAIIDFDSPVLRFFGFKHIDTIRKPTNRNHTACGFFVDFLFTSGKNSASKSLETVGK